MDSQTAERCGLKRSGTRFSALEARRTRLYLSRPKSLEIGDVEVPATESLGIASLLEFWPPDRPAQVQGVLGGELLVRWRALIDLNAGALWITPDIPKGK